MRLSLGVLVLLIVALSVIGCMPGEKHDAVRTDRLSTNEPRRRDAELNVASPSKSVNKPGGRDKRSVRSWRTPPSFEVSDAKKQEIAREALLNLRRCAIQSDVSVQLPDGVKSTDIAAEILSAKLGEAGFNVVASGQRLTGEHHLAFILEGHASQFDAFDDHYLFSADLRGRVVNRATAQVIAAKDIRRKGRRLRGQAEAARDALETAAAALATCLLGEITMDETITSLIQVDVIISEVDSWQGLDDLCNGLSRHPGVYYASVEQWDGQADSVKLRILCRFDVPEKLPSYVEDLQNRQMKLEVGDREVRIIKSAVDVLK